MPPTATTSTNGHGAAPKLMSSGDPIVDRMARAARGRIPPADLNERDPDFIREQLPLLWLLASLYFRGEVRGPGQHPGRGAGADGRQPLGRQHRARYVGVRHGVQRLLRRRAADATNSPTTSWCRSPGLGALRKFGTLPASRENAERALDSGAALLVYPGGDHEVHRPVWERNRVVFNGRKGFLRLALRNDVPIVPIVAIGGQETSLFLSRGEGLARALRLDRIFRLKVLPISMAIPWGLNIGDFLGHVPLPAKITVEVLTPIDLRAEFGPEPDLDEAYALVTERMQHALDALAAERRLPVIG